MSSSIGEIDCKYENCLTDGDGSVLISFRVNKADAYAAKQTVAAVKTGLANGKERLKIDVDWKREKRSLNANAYFHVLVDKIAKSMQLGADEVKVKMVLDYGTIKTVGNEPYIVALLKKADVNEHYPYAKWMGDFRAPKNGMEYSQYLIYKETHTLDRAEMSRLIHGVVTEAQDLGIETKTPTELANMLDLWECGGE